MGAAIVVLLLAALVRAFAQGAIAWPVVGRFLTAPAILSGVGNTVVMTVAAMSLGLILGVVFAVMALSPNPVLAWVARGYVWLFRGTPLLLQLLIWFNLALVFPRLGIPGVATWRTVDVISPFMATLLGLGINQGAYTSEVVRGGILAVDPGQVEAARSIGMGRMLLLRRVTLPQALRVVLPPLGNEVIGMVKLTSVASVIQYEEVLHSAETVYYANARVIELLIVAAFWYLAVVTLLSLGQAAIERAMGAGVRRARKDEVRA